MRYVDNVMTLKHISSHRYVSSVLIASSKYILGTIDQCFLVESNIYFSIFSDQVFWYYLGWNQIYFQYITIKYMTYYLYLYFHLQLILIIFSGLFYLRKWCGIQLIWNQLVAFTFSNSLVKQYCYKVVVVASSSFYIHLYYYRFWYYIVSCLPPSFMWYSYQRVDISPLMYIWSTIHMMVVVLIHFHWYIVIPQHDSYSWYILMYTMIELYLSNWYKLIIFGSDLMAFSAVWYIKQHCYKVVVVASSSFYIHL